MKTVDKFIHAVNKALSFVDIFGDNLGGTKLPDSVFLFKEYNKLAIKNQFGATKTFDFNKQNSRQIFEEIHTCLESFKSNYPGYVFVHQGMHGNKVITTFSSQIALDGSLSKRERMAIVTREGNKISVRFEIREIFTEIL